MVTTVFRRATAVVVCLLCAVVAVAGCTANPPPPSKGSTPAHKPVDPSLTANKITIAVDNIGHGFNPHLASDQSTANKIVSALTLPSAFDAVLAPDKTTRWVQRRDVVTSAKVVSTNPMTVAYDIAPDAQWSDGAPIAAEDFLYLWQQMVSQPGAANSAGYRLITDVRSSKGGKHVEVVFARPYPQWRSLFHDLLPSHSVRNGPGGFASALDTSSPVSGSYFEVKSVDQGRDEVTLVRNDRYWGKPSQLDSIVVRRAGTPAQLANSLRSGDVQMASVSGTSAVREQLAAIAGVRTAESLEPRMLSVTANLRTSIGSSKALRTTILSGLDKQLLVASATNGAIAAPDDSYVYAPSDAQYRAAGQQFIDARQVNAELTAAGYVKQLVSFPSSTSPAPTSTPVPPPKSRDPAPPSQSAPPSTTDAIPNSDATNQHRGSEELYVKDGQPLHVTIGVAADDSVSNAVAHDMADQLRALGIYAQVSQFIPANLYAEGADAGAADFIVGWNRVAADPAVNAASTVWCRSDAAVTWGPNSPTSNPARPDSSSPSASSQALDTGNVSGVCDPGLSANAITLLTSRDDQSATFDAMDRRIAGLGIELPLYQDVNIIAVSSGVRGVPMYGPLITGVFVGAQKWTRNTP